MISAIEKPRPAISPAGTTLPRHMAAVVDNVIATVSSLIAAKQVPEEWPFIVVAIIGFVYLAYFFVFNLIFGTTPGKFSTGLKVLSFDGKQCTVRQILIRTLFRIVETNPLLLGALPAAVRIIGSRDKQRFGDLVARTIVVFRR